MSPATLPKMGRSTTDRKDAKDARQVMWDEHERNLGYFLEHATDLFARHPDQWLLIHSGSEVEIFDDLAELFERRNTFSGAQRGAAIIERHKTGVWVL